jgi:hypothetical protein
MQSDKEKVIQIEDYRNQLFYQGIDVPEIVLFLELNSVRMFGSNLNPDELSLDQILIMLKEINSSKDHIDLLKSTNAIRQACQT